MTWWGSFEVCNNRKRNIPWMPEGGAQSKGKDHVSNRQEREILKTFWAFYTISFFLFFSVFSFEGWVPIPFEINNLFFPPIFFLGRGKINKSTAEGNGFKQWAGVWNSALGKSSAHSLPSLISFVCKWTYTVGLTSNGPGGTVKELAQYHYFKEVLGLLQVPLYVYF